MVIGDWQVVIVLLIPIGSFGFLRKLCSFINKIFIFLKKYLANSFFCSTFAAVRPISPCFGKLVGLCFLYTSPFFHLFHALQIVIRSINNLQHPLHIPSHILQIVFHQLIMPLHICSTDSAIFIKTYWFMVCYSISKFSYSCNIIIN